MHRPQPPSGTSPIAGSRWRTWLRAQTQPQNATRQQCGRPENYLKTPPRLEQRLNRPGKSGESHRYSGRWDILVSDSADTAGGQRSGGPIVLAVPANDEPMVAQTRDELADALIAGAEADSAVVMTMGALHAGHVALIRRARELVGPDGLVTVTIFVNPLQFGPGEDFERYPRTLESDLEVR